MAEDGRNRYALQGGQISLGEPPSSQGTNQVESGISQCSLPLSEDQHTPRDLPRGKDAHVLSSSSWQRVTGLRNLFKIGFCFLFALKCFHLAIGTEGPQDPTQGPHSCPAITPDGIHPDGTGPPTSTDIGFTRQSQGWPQAAKPLSLGKTVARKVAEKDGHKLIRAAGVCWCTHFPGSEWKTVHNMP